MSGSSFSRRGKFDRLLQGTAGVTPIVAMLAVPQPGMAAVLPTANTVGVCSGVSLPKSTITNLVTPIVQAGIQPIENTTNSILHTGALSTLLGALSSTTLNVDLSSTVAAVSAGQPITLQVLADNGSVLGPQSSCYARADGVTLTNAAGLAIGGNIISGLGDTAQPAASAGDINSIAFGNKATSDVLAKGSVAIGTNSTIGAAGSGAVAIGNGSGVAALNGIALGNAAQANGSGGVAIGGGASVQAANSVAIGAGSTASRGGGAYTGYALTVPTLSAGEVSVGTSGAARQLTNLAPGSAGTDAVNVDQLTAVNAQVAATASTVSTLGASVTKNTADIATNAGDIAGLKTSVTKNTTDIATNAGDIAGLKTSVTKNTADIATNVGDIAGLKTSVTKNTTDIAANVADIAGLKTNITKNATDIATNVSDIAGLKTNVTKNTADIATNVSDIAGLKTNVTKNTADIATNVGDIAGLKTSLTKNTTDIATNVSDIAGLKTGVTKNTADIATNAGDIAGLKTSVTKNTADIVTNASDIVGLKTSVTKNTADIATNVSDIADLKTNVTKNTTDIATNVSDIAGLKTNVTKNTTDIATNVSDIAGLKTSVTKNTTDIATNAGDIAGLKTSVMKNTSDIGTNTASIDAIVTRVTTNETNIGDLDTRVKASADEIATVDARVTRNTADIALNTTAIGTLRDDVSDGAIGPVRYSDHATPTTPNGGVPSNDVTLVGATPAAVGVHNVAAGDVSATSTDAVNGSQLYALESRIPGDGGLGVAYDDATRGHVTLGGVAATARVGLSNLADGAVADGSSEAVTGSQLFATNQSVGTLGQNVTRLSTTVADHSDRLDTLDVETAANSGAIGAVGGRMTTAELNIASLNGRIAINTDAIADNTSAIGAIGDRMTTAEGDLGDLGTRVAANTGDISSLGTSVTNNTTAITTVDARVTNITTRVNANSDAITALDTRVTGVSDNVASLDARFGSFSAAVANGGVGPVQYSEAATPITPNGGTPTNDLTLVGATAGPVGLHNVAAGTVSATSTDAVNGSQLYAVASSVTGDSGLAVAYDSAARGHVTLGGAGATAPIGLSNLADGIVAAGSSDAVTGSQLAATNLSVATVGSDVDRLSGVVTGLGGTITTVSNNVTALGDRYTSLDDAFTGFAGNVTNGAIGPVRYSDAATPTVANGGTPSQELTLVGAVAGTVGLHNLTDGRIAAGSSDAVTGGQLATIGNAVASTLGGVAYDPATNSFTGNYTYLGNHYTTVQAALDAIQTDSTGSSGGYGIKYFHTNSTDDDSRATGANATAIGAQAVASGSQSVAMGNNAQATGTSAVAIGDGAMAQDGKAVSIGVGNIASGDGAVAVGDPNTAVGNGSVALGKDNGANGTGAIALGNVNMATGDGAVSLGTGNAAAGAGAVALGAANSATGLGAIAIGSNNDVTGDGSLAIGSGVTTSAVDTLAIGTSTSATAANALAIGNRSSAKGLNAIAVGVDSTATSELASAYGQGSAADNVYATAIGAQAKVSTIAGTAIGTGTVVNGFAGTAIGTGATVDHDNSVALGAAVETTRGALTGYTAFGLDTAQSSNGEIAVAQNMTYIDPRTGQPSTTGARQITGVAAGSMGTDAVNVSQLRGVSDTIGTAVASGFGGGASYDAATGRVTGGSYTVSGVTYGNVGDAVQALATRTSGSTGTTVAANDPGAVHYVDATGGTITLASGGTLISNVAAGGLTAGSTDAVNGAQLAATNARVDATATAVTTLSTRVDNGATGVVQYASATAPTASNGGTKTNDATLVGADAAAPVALHNVASGTVASGSTDAVNGGQLAVTNARVASVEATANSAMASAQGAVQYDDSSHAAMTLGGGGAASPVAVRNVADGTAAHDAVNVSQLVSTADATLGQAETYTDAKVGQLAFDLGKVRKDLAAGTAGALAMAGMPQPYEAGRGMIAMGFGTFLGQTAMAVGLSKALSGRTHRGQTWCNLQQPRQPGRQCRHRLSVLRVEAARTTDGNQGEVRHGI